MEIICLECSNVLDSLEALFLSLGEFNPKLHKAMTHGVICEECKSELLIGSYYFIDGSDFEDFQYDCVEKISETLSKSITYCDASDCEGGEAIYVKNKFEDEMNEDDDESYEWSIEGDSIESLLDAALIHKDHESSVIEQLRCQNCGRGERPTHKDNMYSIPFTKYDEYFSEIQIRDFYGEIDFDELKSAINFCDNQLTSDEIEQFVDMLLKHKKLPMNHPIGQVIYNELKKLFDRKGYYLLHDSKLLYRARPNGNTVKYDKSEMWEPPLGYASHGRYNAVGDSVLYCANKVDILPSEVHTSGSEPYLDIALLMVNNPMRLLPIDAIFGEFQGFMFDNSDDEAEKNKKLKKKYILSNFVKDCCADIGFDGVVYKSVHNSSFTNYAFFNIERSKDIEVLQVFRYIPKPKKYDVEYYNESSIEFSINQEALEKLWRDMK